jgi:hypothetical protein
MRRGRGAVAQAASRVDPRAARSFTIACHAVGAAPIAPKRSVKMRYILSCTFVDEHRASGPGTYILCRTGSEHQASTPDRCTFLEIVPGCGVRSLQLSQRRGLSCISQADRVKSRTEWIPARQVSR